MCDSCGASRESEWKRCPFCRASLTPTAPKSADESDRFDALAAEAEFTESAVLPSPISVEEDNTDASDLITEQDLAHLTGLSGPEVHGWDSQVTKPAAPASEPEDEPSIDAPVSKAILVPLVVAAAAVVLFAAYSIVSSSTSPRPDAVALVDQTTTTEVVEISTSETTSNEVVTGGIGVELAEQVSRLCSRQQFSIARAQAPSLATFNDLVTATKDGRDDWITSPDHQTLRSSVPPLVGCLTTFDGGEIDRCPTDSVIISRRSVEWTYRVLQTIDGTELGSDSGTATDVRPCDELLLEAGNRDSAFWSQLPDDRLAAVAATYTTAPHPSAACSADGAPSEGEPLAFTEPLTLDAAHIEASDALVELPSGWVPSDERPVEAIACLTTTDADAPDTAENTGTSEDPAALSCPTTVDVTVALVDGTPLGSWNYETTTCPDEGELVAPPTDWWTDTVGPALGYADEESSGE